MGLLDWLTRDLTGGDLVEDFGEITAGQDADGPWVLTARLRRRRHAHLLQLGRLAPDRAGPDVATARIPFRSVERLLEPFSDVGWRIEAGHGPTTDPGSRVTARLIGLVGLEIVHTWQDVGGVAEGRGRRTDLVLVRQRASGRYQLLVFGPGSGRGLWPPELASAVLDLAPRLRTRCVS